MTSPLAASILDIVQGLQLGTPDQDASNRFALDGLALSPRPGGALELAARRFEAASLRIASGPLVLEVARLALHKLVGEVRTEGGTPRLTSLGADHAELSGVKIQGPLVLSLPPGIAPHAAHARGAASAHATGHASAGAWSLGPLAGVDGTVRAEIVDAHLLFDADVTVPIRQGRIDFNAATVEHVGPDSRMGASRLGIYVDAPNGRSYLYQFSSAPAAGVEYERGGALLGPRVSDRGHLRLQEFAEGLLRQGAAGHGLGLTDQARLLFDRTALSGDVQLGDGSFAAPGVQAEVVGRAEGRNRVRLHSQAVGRGLTVEMASLSARDAVLNLGGAQLRCAEASGSLMLRLFVDGAQLRFEFTLASLKLVGLRLAATAVSTAPTSN
jgi:hypothetical protein